MNPADLLRTYKISELERIAYTEFKKLGDLIVIPVDIDQTVENFHDIDIDVQRGLNSNYHIWGMVGKDLDNDKFIIIVDDILLDSEYLRTKYRMTVSEEFAHVLLHREAIEKVRTIEAFKALHNHSKWYKYERNAKWLASSILIPYEHILNDCRKLYKQMIQAVGFGNPEAIKKQIANFLAQKYEVSISSMKYRLSNWPVDAWKKIDEATKYNLEFLE